MKVLIPLCEKNKVCKHFMNVRMFALIHFDVQARRVFNWSMICAPSEVLKSLKRWILDRRPDFIVTARIEDELSNFIYANNIRLIACKPGLSVGVIIDRILKGSWMPEIFDYRHLKSNAEILHK